MPVRRPVTLALAMLVHLMLSALPASADVVGVEDPVSPEMSINISYPTTYTQKVCWSGRLRGTSASSPTWRVLTTGVRSDGMPIVDGPWFYPGASWSDCFTVDKRAVSGRITDAGAYTTTFSYDGVGADIPSVIVGAGLWTGTQNNKIEAHQ